MSPGSSSKGWSGSPSTNSNFLAWTEASVRCYRERTTVHGVCRASFSTWANDNGIARPDVIEACLAHREADKVRAAYNRAAFHAERAALLRAWGDFCDGRQSPGKVTRRRKSAAVVRFPGQRAKTTNLTRPPQAADPSSGELLADQR